MVIVTWNRVDTIMQALSCIKLQTIRPAQIVVVDNGSKDSTVVALKKYEEMDIDIVELEHNYGYAYGLTEGIRYGMKTFSDIDHYLLMDDDSHPSREFLEGILRARKAIGKASMICTMGVIERLWKGPVIIFKDAEKDRRIISADPKIYTMDHGLVDGALIDKSIVDQVGTPRGDFFMMCEDYEYSKRIKKAGFLIATVEFPSNIERHHQGGGTKFSSGTLWRGYYHSRNHMIILKEYFTPRMLLSYILRQTKYLLFSLKAPDRWHRIGLRLLGIWHGVIGKTGKVIDPEKIYEQYKSR